MAVKINHKVLGQHTQSITVALQSISCVGCDPMDYSLPDSSVHGIFQARVLEWDAIAFSRTVVSGVLH